MFTEASPEKDFADHLDRVANDTGEREMCGGVGDSMESPGRAKSFQTLRIEEMGATSKW